MFVCVRVVLLTVLIAISQLTLEGDDLAAGSWMRTQSELSQTGVNSCVGTLLIIRL